MEVEKRLRRIRTYLLLLLLSNCVAWVAFFGVHRAMEREAQRQHREMEQEYQRWWTIDSGNLKSRMTVLEERFEDLRQEVRENGKRDIETTGSALGAGRP